MKGVAADQIKRACGGGGEAGPPHATALNY